MLMFKALAFLVLVSGTAVQASNVTLYTPLFEQHSNSTPKFRNTTHINPNPLIVALAGNANSSSSSFAKRQSGDNGLDVGMCAPGAPCVNGACCGKVRVLCTV